MRKKALQLASVASMIEQFNMSNIRMLKSLGYEVHVVADFTNPGNISNNRAKELIKTLNDIGVKVYDVAIPRSINPILILRSYKKIKEIFVAEHYNLVHCHSPIGGAVCRFVARKERGRNLRVIYTAHGFHFYTGAPIKNWVLFYPIEKICSKWTDVLITINEEDYSRAKIKFKKPKVEYVPGIGIDTKKFELENFDRNKKRKELDIDDNSKMLLSIGELNHNKNHEVVINAISEIPTKEKIHYCIAGKGVLSEQLKRLAEKEGVRLHLLGYRTDIEELLNCADVFILPSKREGLSVALMEAMASGLPCIASDIRGNRDLISEKGGYLVNPNDRHEFSRCIKKIINEDNIETQKMAEYNQKKSKAYDEKIILEKMNNIYSEV